MVSLMPAVVMMCSIYSLLQFGASECYVHAIITGCATVIVTMSIQVFAVVFMLQYLFRIVSSRKISWCQSAELHTLSS